MRGQKEVTKQMRRGRTIVAEREQAESESERMQARRRTRRKKNTAAVIVLLMGAVLALSAYLGIEQLSKKRNEGLLGGRSDDVRIEAQVVDEDNRGQISTRVREYIAQLEGDFRDLGYVVSKVTLPTGASREIYVDIDGWEGMFIKVNIDRETAVSAEDAARMLRYLAEHDLHPGYVDVRVVGRAYYK